MNKYGQTNRIPSLLFCANDVAVNMSPVRRLSIVACSNRSLQRKGIQKIDMYMIMILNC